jgi:hypothetical protein
VEGIENFFGELNFFMIQNFPNIKEFKNCIEKGRIYIYELFKFNLYCYNFFKIKNISILTIIY